MPFRLRVPRGKSRVDSFSSFSSLDREALTNSSKEQDWPETVLSTRYMDPRRLKLTLEGMVGPNNYKILVCWPTIDWLP
jgi:hypothetical protein